MVKKEFTHIRNLDYSAWHRTLSGHCYVMDLDWIEWRKNRGIVALIETKKSGYASNFEIKVLFELSTKLNIPVYIVTYNDLKKFNVINLMTNTE